MKFVKILALSLLTTTAFASTTTVKIYETAATGQGAYIGTVSFTDTPMGLLIEPKLSQLSPGLHGFHVHDHASCDHMGLSAMGHLDPQKTGKHLGPYNVSGHLGDLPALYVDKNGVADLPTIAPRLKVKEIQGHAIMIHAGGDNYSDLPAKLGGGGERIACGVVS